MIGFLNIYKPSGVTSFKVVSIVKKLFNTKRVGHLGTLDPMAEGVLPIAIGKATKLFDYFLTKDKEYDATFKCGVLTDSLDITGNVLEENNFVPTLNDVQKASLDFIGKINQIPPKFSAKKINGKRAYKLARDGIKFDCKPNEVQIYAIKAQSGADDSLFNFKICCSAGTYIRSLGVDILSKVNAISTMTNLVRTRSGCFNIIDSVLLEDLSKNPLSYLLSVQDVLNNLTKINVNDDIAKKLKNGMTVKYNIDCNEFLILHNDVVLGIGNKIDNDYIKIKINLLEDL